MFAKLKRFFEHRASSWIILALLMAATILFAEGGFKSVSSGMVPRDGKMHIRFFDVGQGDAALIVMPDGADVLVDGGPDGRIAELLGRALPPYDRSLELVVLSHPHVDHLSGLLEVLKHYKVEKIMMYEESGGSFTYKEWLRQIESLNIPVIYPRYDDALTYGGATLKILGPGAHVAQSTPAEEKEGLNDNSLVLLAAYGDDSALFMGDAGEAEEKELLEKTGDLDADILKVGHHGSKYSSSLDFLKQISPAYAIISVGAGNSFGHPGFRTVRNLSRKGAQIFRTDINGSIDALLDGRAIKFSAERSSSGSCAEGNILLKLLARCF